MEDPAKQRKLFLIGTTNSSTLLATRTKKLIENERPDTVFLQTNSNWAQIVKSLKADTQSDLNLNNALLRSAFSIDHPNNFRGLVFKARLFSWLAFMNFIKGNFFFYLNYFLNIYLKGFPSDFHPFIPGLEMKFALEGAEKLNSKIILGGLELDETTLFALLTEKRMDFIFTYLNSLFSLHNKLWKNEYQDHYKILHTHGGEAFAENMDRSRLNWFVKLFEKIAPYRKKIIIDQKDERYRFVL